MLGFMFGILTTWLPNPFLIPEEAQLILGEVGEFRSKKDTVHYVLYPNLINESSNIIILQIDKISQVFVNSKAVNFQSSN